jgi:hypothetical protein
MFFVGVWIFPRDYFSIAERKSQESAPEYFATFRDKK